MPDQLEQLKKITSVVADTGDIEAIKLHQPEDATTNPSLILKAAQLPQYQSLLEESVDEVSQQLQYYPKGSSKEQIATELFSVKVGDEISKLVPGRVSTEVDARLSFDTQAMIDSAKRLIHFYEQNNVDRQRILIKLAGTWEGIQAAKALEALDINCNVTLIFSFYQALAAAQAKVFLISPFVGRILDWYKKAYPEQEFSGAEDPGVKSVTEIYQHFKHNKYKTIVMGASFRNISEIQQLAGCDKLTISPQLMNELANTNSKLEHSLSSNKSKTAKHDIHLNETSFRWFLNQDAMATEKLAEGIRNFTLDQEKLELLIANRL